MPNHSILRHSLRLSVLTASLRLYAGAAQAQALKYTPTNPHLADSLLNGDELMAWALVQKDIKGSPLSATGQSAIGSFTTNLDSRISVDLSQYICNQLFSASGTGSNSGTVSLGSLHRLQARRFYRDCGRDRHADRRDQERDQSHQHLRTFTRLCRRSILSLSATDAR